MGFVMSGNWYYTTSTVSFAEHPNDGLNIDTEIEEENLLVSLPDNAMVYEFQIQYNPRDLSFDIPADYSELWLFNRNEEEGIITVMAEKDEIDQLPITILFKSRKP